MNKFKNGLKKILSYIAARRLLRYSIIVVVVIILLPTGVILTNKYFNNKVNNIEDTKEESLNINDSDKIKDNSITKGIIETDVVADKTYSKHTLSDGFSTLSEDDYNSSSNTDKNNITNSTSNNISQSIDKSSLTGIDLEILEGYEFNPKKDLKLQATDKDGRNISDSIIIEKNNVNTTIPGSYIVKASVKLSNGQYKEREFNVIVKETTLEVSLKSFKSIKVNIKKGEKIGATRVIPLIIDEKKILEAEKIIKEKIISVEEIKPKKAVLITTGNEVYKGRIKDAFLPVMKEKLEYYGSEIVKQIILPDNKEMITENILKAIEEDKVDMIICTGGMSVDPDDVTPSAIKDCNGEIVTYGAPVLPGAMFLLAYYKNIPILGVPSCAMYSKRTIFDLVLPRILADEKLSFEDIARFGNGGMCLNCEICSFPHCSFGK